MDKGIHILAIVQSKTLITQRMETNEKIPKAGVDFCLHVLPRKGKVIQGRTQQPAELKKNHFQVLRM